MNTIRDTLKTKDELLKELMETHRRLLELETIIKQNLQRQETARDNERKYHSLFNSVNDCIFIYDAATGTLLDVNEKVYNMYGYNPQESINVNLQALTVSELPYNYSNALILKNKAINGEPQNFEWLARHRSGSFFWIDVQLKMVRLEDKDCLLAIIRDISEHRELEEIWKRYEFIVNTSREFMTLIDKNYVYEAINESYSKAHGRPREQVVGCSVSEVWGQEAFNLIIKKYLDTCLAGNVVNYQAWFDFHTLGLKFLDVTYYPYVDTKGSVTHAVVVSRDITDKKHAEDLLSQSRLNMERTLEGAIKAIILMIEMRDPYTAGHQRRVSALASVMAKQMGFSEDRIEGIKVMGFLHDIGKIVVPAEILSKPSKLNDYEFNIIKAHSQSGYDILKRIEFPWPVAQAVLQHHERIDGSGYPIGIRNDEIMPEAKILAVADVVESMASHRPYRAALGVQKALDEITSKRGTLYDPKTVDVCVKLFMSKQFRFE
ncbi:MAG: PAS domain S-box protein [Nitrospirae bacterium]|nr:PAS domain S-box protein [Nitrospirota bacterium]